MKNHRCSQLIRIRQKKSCNKFLRDFRTVEASIKITVDVVTKKNCSMWKYFREENRRFAVLRK